MTTRFWIGVAVGAAAAWYFGRPKGVGGAAGGAAPRSRNRVTRYSGLGRFGAR